RKHGKPHQEFVKSLCTYKDIFELKTESKYLPCSMRCMILAIGEIVQAIGCLTVLPAIITTRPMDRIVSISFFVWDYTDDKKGHWVTQDEAYSPVKENVARGNQVKHA
ncbi:hypothetical protein HID58_074201, partial [Brassica napus]